MDAPDFKSIRHRLGLSVDEYAMALGYTGPRQNACQVVRRYEAGLRPLPDHVSRLARMFDLYGIPREFLPIGSTVRRSA